MVDYRTANFEQDIRTGAETLGFTDKLVSTLIDNPRLLYEDYVEEMGIKLPSIQIRVNKEVDVQSHTTVLLLRRNFILTIHPLLVDRRFTRLRRYSETILKKIPVTLSAEDKLTTLLIRIIDQNNDRNFEHLRQIEERGDDLNKGLLDPDVPRTTLGPQIYGMKHALITYLDALWQTVDVLHDLRYGDADLLTNEPKLLERIEYLSEDVSHQIGLAEHMSDVLASGLEVLQSIYNNQLQAMNNRMALLMTYFTVLGTAVLVPNTLATVLGNSAFGMGTKDAWWYIILLVGSTLLAIVLTVWWVKKSGLIPKKMD
ncbi:MAG: magnesium transporter CorA [Dehalococcoidia bacterium]|nr:MAG: magnesium transporter CorA [Dehalococcoidia bacterium]